MLMFFEIPSPGIEPGTNIILLKAVTDVVKYKLSFAEVEQGRPATVKDAAMCFKDIVYEYRDSLMAGLIVAGFDKVRLWHYISP